MEDKTHKLNEIEFRALFEIEDAVPYGVMIKASLNLNDKEAEKILQGLIKKGFLKKHEDKDNEGFYDFTGLGKKTYKSNIEKYSHIIKEMN